MQKIILDTSICVDLSNADLLEAVLKLPFSFLLPDVIAEELKDPRGEMLVQMGYKVIQLPAEQVQRVVQLGDKYVQASRQDVFALVCAQFQRCLLLTGDQLLRKAAEAEQIEVHGVLWIVDELAAARVLSKQEAWVALEKMVKGGSRLPKKDVDERFSRWKE